MDLKTLDLLLLCFLLFSPRNGNIRWKISWNVDLLSLSERKDKVENKLGCRPLRRPDWKDKVENRVGCRPLAPKKQANIYIIHYFRKIFTLGSKFSGFKQ